MLSSQADAAERVLRRREYVSEDSSEGIAETRVGSHAPESRVTPLVRLDAGWLFLIAGVGLLGATVLIPAQRELALARWQRDQAAAIERQREERRTRYGGYLNALDRNDESVVLSLVGTQLNKSPADRVPITLPGDPAIVSASVFPSLEPPALRLVPTPDFKAGESTLERWTTDEKVRVWMLAGGVLSILVGLLPPARARG